MFVQIIEGRLSDEEGLRRQMDRWMAELKSGATGYQGTTAGVTADGGSIAFVRFDSASSAQANSDRREQGEWWAETEKCFSGAVSFTESSDVELSMGGGGDDAGFVQVMKVSGVDRAQAAEMDEVFERLGPTERPDVIGGLRAWTGPDSYVEAIYFTSEAEARENEAKEMPAEVQQAMAALGEATVEYLDLHDPWLYS